MAMKDTEAEAIQLLLRSAGMEPGGDLSGLTHEATSAINRTILGDDLVKNYAQKYPTIAANLVVRAMHPVQLSAFIHAFIESYRNKMEE